ncbi:hypothetical protein T492DRAFT_888934 [Pavlovales sp. CCMP2436]|nr:hypothetical protein T492DRAFT_888934 [Pavlovales sp. CCMP2436]
MNSDFDPTDHMGARPDVGYGSFAEASEGATAAAARLKGGMVRSGSTPGKHQARLHPSGTTSGRGAAGIRVPAA